MSKLVGWEDRKNLVKAAMEHEDPEDKYTELKGHICGFFKPGNYSPCIKCDVANYDLDECTEYFLDRIDFFKIDEYIPKFDLPINKQREKKKLSEMQDIGMSCNSCYMSEKCPEYERHASCAIDFGEVPAGNTEKLDKLIDMQYQRITRASTFELVDGGVPDTNLSSEMDRLTGMLAMKDDLGRDKLSVSIEASRDGTKPAGGLLASLFGGLNQAPAQPALEPAKTEDIIHIDVSEPVKVPMPTVNPEFVPDKTVDKYEPRKMPPPPKRK